MSDQLKLNYGEAPANSGARLTPDQETDYDRKDSQSINTVREIRWMELGDPLVDYELARVAQSYEDGSLQSAA